ncbi:hypothetical protein [Corynebacterium stationis]|uniref:hypothetical protein n=1 Tax=Corynebacterium stationis TaxID=1705 RepID=UPI003C6C2352
MEPIARTAYARRKPLSFEAAVTEGLRRYVHGDKNYSGLMTKKFGPRPFEGFLVVQRAVRCRQSSDCSVFRSKNQDPTTTISNGNSPRPNVQRLDLSADDPSN